VTRNSAGVRTCVQASRTPRAVAKLCLDRKLTTTQRPQFGHRDVEVSRQSLGFALEHPLWSEDRTGTAR